jgi:leucine dehydrogenase
MGVAAVKTDLVDEEFEEVREQRGSRSGLTVTVAIHRTVGGVSLGGCRMRPYASDADAVADAKRLAHSMTFKAAAAGLAIGGGKGVIALPADEPISFERRRDALHDFADLVESLRGRYVTAQDVGTSEEDVAYMGTITRHVAGHPIAQGGSGDPSPYTAHGVEVAIRASLPGGDVNGRHIAIVGLGHVGGALAERLAADGARLTVADADPGKRALADRLGARWVSAEDAFETDADLFSPCALGGTLSAEMISRLGAPVVAGAANNQLSDDSAAGELAQRGVLWAPDFIANAGGLIAVVAEYRSRRFDRDRTERAVEEIGATLKEVYRRAGPGGNTLLAATALAAERAAAADHGAGPGAVAA